MSGFEESKEEWNTGIGYYMRINQLLNLCDEYQIKSNITDWYSVLLCLYKELLPKLKGEKREEIDAALQVILTERNTTGKVGGMKLFLFEIKIREMLEHKGMLTPRGDDPSNAYLNG